ncbi:MAG: hypothetical protein D3921_10945 [Candidatus Electrothrix sp. AW1]|nr:hypothetical protein [Candidatus Electrothrix gigas]
MGRYLKTLNDYRVKYHVNVLTAYSYDRRGLLTGIVNGNGAETLFEHNGVGKLIKEIDPLHQVWEYAYDGNRNRISRRDAKGELTEYSFYPDDMLEQIRYADGSSVAYQYDANNNRIGMNDKLGQTTWAFDPLNRVTEQNDPFERVLGYQYDAASNRTGITYPDGNQVGYAYSPNNWLKRMTVNPVGTRHAVSLQTEYYRDMVGNLTQIVNPNQTETTVAYDKVYRTLERINRQVTQGGKTNSGFRYTYNEVGHITEAIKEYGWRKPSVVTEAYEYDGLHRLSYMNMSPIKNNGGMVETAYSYDPVGNRLSWESNDDLQTNTPYDGFYRSYEYNAANQMLAMENAADKKNDDYAYEYSFDANGNRINRQLIDRNGPQYGVDYSYDPENRLVLAQDYQMVGGSKKEAAHRIDRAFTTLEYDGGGRRLVQHYDPKQGGNGVDKRDEYVFDGLDPVAEYDMLNGQRTDYYRGAGNHLALMHQYKDGTQGQMYWYHYNNKGDVVGLTKHNGNSHHNYRYDPYGAVLPENGNFTDPHNHYTLTGKEFDENTGLVWFGARHYEPETGVWMGQDSYRGRLSEPGSLHRFGYVNNNPTNNFDFYGYFSLSDALKTIFFIPTAYAPGPEDYMEPDSKSEETEAEKELPDPVKEERLRLLNYMRDEIIDPVVNDFKDSLDSTGGYVPSVDKQLWKDLLLGTAAQESGFKLRHQRGGGPALGLFQIEQCSTHDPMWKDELNKKGEAYFTIVTMKAGVTKKYLKGKNPVVDDVEDDLVNNDKYGAAIALNIYLMHIMHDGGEIDLFKDLSSIKPVKDIEDPGYSDYLDELANLWVKHYNTKDGEGTPKKFKENWYRYVLLKKDEENPYVEKE